MSVRTFLLALALLLAAVAPANAAIVVNEAESSGIFDYIELTNTGPAPVDISGYILKDDNNNRTLAVPAGTPVLAVGGYYVQRVDSGPGNFGLGDADQARVFTPGNVALDGISWNSSSPTTWGRCPNGTGAVQITTRPSPGAANSCPAVVPASVWPGGASVTLGDPEFKFGENMSGLAYQPSGSAARGTLWAVRNDEARLYKLAFNGTRWVDADDNWSTGKRLRYAGGVGNPDAEGITLAGAEPNAVYAATERNGENDTVSLPMVLRYDVSSASAELAATQQWDLTTSLEPLGANQGLEAIAWMPDDVLVAKGLFDETKGAKYNPADYPQHGSGLFFVGVEQDGSIAAFALAPGLPPSKVAVFPSGFINVQDLEYEPETKLLWATCDNNCNGRTATLDIAASGRFEVVTRYERPTGMDNLNNEGFAIAPQAECASQVKPAFWLDDTNVFGNAIRVGTIRCTVPTTIGDPGPPPPPTPDATASPQPTAVPTAVPTPVPTPAVDRTAPKVKLSLTKPATKGTYAVRKTGKLKLTVTLDERSDLTITATARKNSKAKARTLTKTTRKGIAAGKPSYTLTLSKKLRKALKKGETITLTVQARDAAGNVGNASATGKVR